MDITLQHIILLNLCFQSKFNMYVYFKSIHQLTQLTDDIDAVTTNLDFK